MIYVTDDKSYHSLPKLVPLVAKRVVDQAAAMIAGAQDGDMDPAQAEQFLRGIDLLRTLQKYNYDKEAFYFAVKFSEFRAQEPTADLDEDDTPEDRWGWPAVAGVLALGGDFFPFMEAAHKQVLANRGGVIPRKLTKEKMEGIGAQIKKIESGAWTLQNADEERDISRLMEGKAVAVYINGKGFMGRNKTVSATISAAQTYDSLEAAKRSVKAYKTSYYRGGQYSNITYVEIETAMTRVLETTENNDTKMQSAQAKIQKREMIKQLGDFTDRPQSRIKKKM